MTLSEEFRSFGWTLEPRPRCGILPPTVPPTPARSQGPIRKPPIVNDLPKLHNPLFKVVQNLLRTATRTVFPALFHRVFRRSCGELFDSWQPGHPRVARLDDDPDGAGLRRVYGSDAKSRRIRSCKGNRCNRPSAAASSSNTATSSGATPGPQIKTGTGSDACCPVSARVA